MKWIFQLLLVAISGISMAQSIDNTATKMNAKAGAALVLNKLELTGNMYYRQINSQPGNANAWLQFYLWLGKTKQDKETQAQTMQASQQYIAQSWQYSLMRFVASGKRDAAAIAYALNNTDDKALVYPYAIHHAIIMGDNQLLKQYATALNNIAPLSAALYEYHYNALMSAGAHALIYAKGLTDLAPMAILQQVYGIRTDVQLKYFENTIPDKGNAYLCLSAGKEMIENFPSASYSGLLISINGQNDMAALGKKLNQFSLEKMNTLTTLSDTEISFYKNYLPSFLLLYKWYRANKNTEAAIWRQHLFKLGSLTGTTAQIEKAIAD